MKERYLDWARKFFESWKNLEGVETMELFSKDVEYYETALGTPCKSFDEVVKLWAVVPQNQSNISYNYEIVAFNENHCVINWRMSRTLLSNNTLQHIDGIIVFALDNNNLCTFFKQWRYTE